jgi:hypothetical protein
MFDLVMQEIPAVSNELDAEFRSQFGGRISGYSTNKDGPSTITVLFNDPFTQADETAAQAIIDAHDPVFITAERTGDDITVTLSKPRNLDSATELTPSFDDEAADTPTQVIDNVATFTVESADSLTIGIVEDYPHQEVTI